MIVIDNVLISDSVIEEQFVCDLHQCKGACCEDGDAGAPLSKQETKWLKKDFQHIETYLTEEGKKEISSQGTSIYDDEFGWVTPTINDGICAYGIKNEEGVILCAIEKAYLDKKINWKKPISCHLFPIRISANSADPDIEHINYEYRESTCKAACGLGKQLKMPVYVFLKEALIAKYGAAFYDDLEATATHFLNQ